MTTHTIRAVTTDHFVAYYLYIFSDQLTHTLKVVLRVQSVAENLKVFQLGFLMLLKGFISIGIGKNSIRKIPEIRWYLRIMKVFAIQFLVDGSWFIVFFDKIVLVAIDGKPI